MGLSVAAQASVCMGSEVTRMGGTWSKLLSLSEFSFLICKNGMIVAPPQRTLKKTRD